MGRKKGLARGTPTRFLKIQCSCSGNNPNCFKCGGWGYIDSIGEGRASAGPAGAPSSSREGGGFVAIPRSQQKARRLRACPVCGVLVRKLEKHARTVHGLSAAQRAPVRAVRMFEPVTAQPSKKEVRKVRGVVVTVLKRPSAKTLKLKKSRRLTKRRPFGLKPVAGGAPQQESPEGHHQNDKEIRRQDATREYAQNYRDHGQFGSHPSHDGFDDESKP